MEENRSLNEEQKSETQKFAEMSKAEKDQTIDEVLAEKEAESKIEKADLKKAINEVKKEITSDEKEKSEQIHVKLNYLDAKKELAALEKEQKSLSSELERELYFARKNGADTKTVERIEELNKNISDVVTKQLDLVKQVNDYEKHIKENAVDRVNNAKEKAGNIVQTIKKYTVDKIVTGLATLSAMKDRVREANHSVMTKGVLAKDAYGTMLREDVEKYNRRMLTRNYSLDKELVVILEKQKEKMRDSYQKRANVKEAVKNLGKAVKGKEMTVGEEKITQKQMDRIAFLEKQIEALKTEMQNMEKQFELSKQLSIQNIKSAQELRRDNDAKEHDGLNARLEDIKKSKISLAKSDKELQKEPAKESDKSQKAPEKQVVKAEKQKTEPKKEKTELEKRFDAAKKESEKTRSSEPAKEPQTKEKDNDEHERVRE